MVVTFPNTESMTAACRAALRETMAIHFLNNSAMWAGHRRKAKQAREDDLALTEYRDRVILRLRAALLSRGLSAEDVDRIARDGE